MKTALGARYAVTGAAYTWYNNQILIGQAIWQKRKGMYVSVKLQHEDRAIALSVTLAQLLQQVLVEIYMTCMYIFLRQFKFKLFNLYLQERSLSYCWLKSFVSPIMLLVISSARPFYNSIVLILILYLQVSCRVILVECRECQYPAQSFHQFQMSSGSPRCHLGTLVYPEYSDNYRYLITVTQKDQLCLICLPLKCPSSCCCIWE